MKKWAKLTAALLIYDSPVVIKCVQWSSPTCCAEMKWWDGPGGQKSCSHIYQRETKGGEQKCVMAGLRGLCQVMQIMTTTSPKRDLSTLSLAFTKRKWQAQYIIANMGVSWYCIGINFVVIAKWLEAEELFTNALKQLFFPLCSTEVEIGFD